jgi:hypothetical protein
MWQKKHTLAFLSNLLPKIKIKTSPLYLVKSGRPLKVGIRATVHVGKDEGVKPYIQNVAKIEEK